MTGKSPPESIRELEAPENPQSPGSAKLTPILARPPKSARGPQSGRCSGGGLAPSLSPERVLGARVSLSSQEPSCSGISKPCVSSPRGLIQTMELQGEKMGWGMPTIV